jgi:hypothetical protein
MLHFLMFFILPLAVLLMLGFSRVVVFLFCLIFVMFIVGIFFGVGMLFEYMFFPKHVASYVMPTLYTDAYANNMTSLAQMFAIPYIVVFDYFKVILHYTFTHSTPVLWFFHLWGLGVLFLFAKAAK